MTSFPIQPTECAFCHQPILKGQRFVCFKQFGKGYIFCHNRPILNDCWEQFLIDHCNNVHMTIVLDQFT